MPGRARAAREGLLQAPYRRGLEGQNLELILTDGCTGLAAALQTIYLRVPHQRRWVYKMRNLLEHVRKRDYDVVKAEAPAISRPPSRWEAEQAFRRFRARWQGICAGMVQRLERDQPELLSLFSFPRHLWRKLRTTNVIERCFMEVRRRRRPMVCFVNVASVDRIIYAIFHGVNEKYQWKNRTPRVFRRLALRERLRVVSSHLRM